MWTLANHSRVPEKVRKEVSAFEMTKYEFEDGRGWQEPIYILESRLLISKMVLIQD